MEVDKNGNYRYEILPSSSNYQQYHLSEIIQEGVNV
jgi:hypothetical protein